MATPKIDLEKLYDQIRQLDSEDWLNLLEHAVELIPKTRLPQLIKPYFKLKDLRPDGRKEEVGDRGHKGWPHVEYLGAFLTIHWIGK